MSRNLSPQGDGNHDGYPLSHRANCDASVTQFGLHSHSHPQIAEISQDLHGRHVSHQGMQAAMHGMPQPSGSVQQIGIAPQSLQWIPNPAMLREISAQGPGTYRLQMTIAPPPAAQLGQAHVYPQSYPGQASYQGYPGYSYYPTLGPAYMQGYPGMMPGLGMVQPGLFENLYQIGEAKNPELGPSVAMLHSSRADIAANSDGNSKKKTRKRKRNNPKAPKPARYAWNFYFKEQYQKIRKDGGSGLFDVQEAFTKVGLRLGNAWKALTPEERQPYLEMAAKDRLRHERETELYNQGIDFRTHKGDDESKKPKVDVDQAKSGNIKDIEKESVTDDESKDSVSDKATEASELKDSGQIDQINVEHQITADILVTDDDDTFIVMMEATLRRIHKDMNGKVNLNIHKAKSGTEALAKVIEEQQRYAVITMDKEMGPNSPDGYQTIRKLREHGYSGFVVGLTGNPGCEESFESNGADATLTKGSAKLYAQIYKYVIEKINDQDMADRNLQADETAKVH